MIKKVTITEVYKSENKADGTPYQYKTDSKYHKAGEHFTRIGIQTDAHGTDTYYTNADPKSKANTIEKGQTLLLSFKEEVDGDNTWRNFNFPSKKELAEFATSMA